MVDGDCRCYCWIGRRWRWCSWRSRGLLLLFSGLMVIATDSNGRSANVAVRVTGVASAVPTSVTGVVSVATAVVTTTTAATALSFSVPVAMQLSRYGRLPSCSIGGCRGRRGYRGSGSRISRCSSPFLLLPQRSLLPCLPQPMLLLQLQSFVHYGRHKAQGGGRRRKHVGTVSQSVQRIRWQSGKQRWSYHSTSLQVQLFL